MSIDPGDICALCKMAISQASYAGQFIDKDGNVLKFDDIGCMIRFVRDNNQRDAVAKFFVMDYDTRQWLDGQQATYVKADRNASPMGSGLTAFRETSRADDYAAKNKGRLLHFEDLWKSGVVEPQHIPHEQR